MKKNVPFLLLISFFSSLVLFAAPGHVYACSCAPPPSVQEELNRSDHVFSGTVLAVKEQRNNKYLTNAVLFEVSEIWKGGPESQRIVHTGTGGGDCGTNFKEGQNYLVYTHLSSMYSRGELTVTTICDRTNEFAHAQEDLTVLGQGEAPTKPVNLLYKFNGTNQILWAAFSVIGVGVFVYIGWKIYHRRT